MTRIRRHGTMFGLMVLVFASAAHAARVRFVSEASAPFNRRIVAELSSVGFDVDETDEVDAPLPEGSVAIVHATNQPARVEVWVVSEPGRIVLSTVIERDRVSGDDADSTKIAERLRALLQPLADRNPDPPPLTNEPAAPVATPPSPRPFVDTRPAQRDTPPTPAPVSPAFKRFRADVGAALSPQTGGAAVSVAAGGRYTFAHPVSARLFLVYPLTASTIEHEGASADLDARIAGLSTELDVLPQSSEIRLAFGVGAGVAWLDAEGHADPPREGRHVEKVAGIGFVDASLGYRFLGDASLLVGALVGVAVPKTDVEFGDSEVGTYGRPLVLTTLSLAYDL